MTKEKSLFFGNMRLEKNQEDTGFILFEYFYEKGVENVTQICVCVLE